MSVDKKLRTLVNEDVLRICEEVSRNINMQFEPNSLSLISELLWNKLLSYSNDLEAFQKHAKRSTINVDDVKLLVRKNADLKKIIEDKSQQIAQNRAESTTSKRKKDKSKD